MTQARMTFGSTAFKNAAEGLSNRANNSDTVSSRMQIKDTSATPSVNTYTGNALRNASEAERQGYANANEGLANNPMFRQTQLNDARNFTEDVRRFDVGQTQKANEQNTIRYQSENHLSGVKYGADAQVKATGLQADASKYGADRNLESNRYMADSNLRATGINADATRFSALLGAGSASLNSQQYRPTFNR